LKQNKENEMRRILIFAILCLFFGSPDAQVHVGVNINIGRQPVWGPVGYDYVEYYYIPDIDVFYYVPTHRWVYLNGGRWIFASRLPARYGNCDLYTVHKEVINEDRPYLRHEFYRDKFIRYKGIRDQKVIRDSRDSKYFIVRGHPEHDKWMNNRGNEKIRGNNGNGRGNGRGNIEHGNGSDHGRGKQGHGDKHKDH
jgi:hypothetical protein